MPGWDLLLNQDLGISAVGMVADRMYGPLHIRECLAVTNRESQTSRALEGLVLECKTTAGDHWTTCEQLLDGGRARRFIGPQNQTGGDWKTGPVQSVEVCRLGVQARWGRVTAAEDMRHAETVSGRSSTRSRDSPFVDPATCRFVCHPGSSRAGSRTSNFREETCL